MNKSRSVGFQSALLVNRGVIICSFVISLLAWWLDADAIAILFLTFSLIGLISLLWGMYALKDLTVTVCADSSVLSVGQTAEITYTIENNKLLPLVWLELCQDVPKNLCIEPDLSMTLREFSAEETEYSGHEKAYMRRFAFLMGNSEISWSCTWTGRRRGVYRPGDLVVRSGDGFGLMQTVGEMKGLAGKTFVVWPKIVPVYTGGLLKDLWNGRTGRSGWSEDITVLRDEREYMEGDNWKRIDWRTAARTDELYTKQFERFRPESILLAVETFELEDAENALSIAASVLWELHAGGVSVGLALPATAEKEAVLIRPDDPSATVEDCLFELSDHAVESASEAGFGIRGILAAAEEAGRIWIIGRDRRSIRAGRLAQTLSHMSYGCLTEANDGTGLSFDSVRIGGAS